MKFHLSPLKSKIEFTGGDPANIGKTVENFYRLYQWLTVDEKIAHDDIVVDPTGGRRWMSSGATMIASFLSLPMVYVHTEFKDGRPDPEKMKMVDLGNAYDQVGFIEADKIDQLFNKGNYGQAEMLYSLLASNSKNKTVLEIKALISKSFTLWQQFDFNGAYESLGCALYKIKNFSVLTQHRTDLERYLSILCTLKDNSGSEDDYFKFLCNDQSVNNIIIHVLAQAERYSNHGQFDLAVLLLYRVLELISQNHLAKHGIDSAKVSDEIREIHNNEFKRIKKEVIDSESEIPKQIALFDGYILLYILKDSIVSDQKNHKFLKGLVSETTNRNLLWIEHGNLIMNMEKYKKFRSYIEGWVNKHDSSILSGLCNFKYFNFSKEHVLV